MLPMASLLPIIAAGEASDALEWARCINTSCCRWYCLGPIVFGKRRQCSEMGQFHWRLPLLMLWDRPIALAATTADALGWAHCIGGYRCRCSGMGPLHWRLQLSMLWDGPIALAATTVDALGWAHCIFSCCHCRWLLFGPLLWASDVLERAR